MTWFTVEQLDSNTYIISEYKHWEETHCYLLCSQSGAFLIDTGLGIEDIKTVTDTLTDQPVTVLTTHVHFDHIGSHGSYTNIGVHESERDWLDGHFPLPPAIVRRNLTAKPCPFPVSFNIDNYSVYQGKPSFTYSDMDILHCGDRTLQVIHTPGHSPGSCCFFEESSGYLFTGDTVYVGKLDAYYSSTDPVAFMHSLDKLKEIPFTRILPGHHTLDVPLDLIDRIDDAFHELDDNGNLIQGNGIFEYRDFQIHI